MVNAPRTQRILDHGLRSLVFSTGRIEIALDSVNAVESLVEFNVAEHNTQLPRFAFRDKPPLKVGNPAFQRSKLLQDSR